MDNTQYTAATAIKIEEKEINNLVADLVRNVFNQDTLLEIYTALGDAGEYLDYVGKLYTSVPAVSFTGGGGADAEGTAVITDGILTAVNVTDPGHDYTSVPEVVFTGGGGAGAAAHALLAGSGDTVASVVVDHVSLIARLKTKITELEADFAAL